jgi:glycerate 2-kinase
VRPVLIAVGPFASLRASQAAAAIERGLEAEGFVADLCPASDGGPGTLETLLVALGGEALRGGFALIEDGATAVVDAFEDPARTTEALMAAGAAGAGSIVLAARGRPRPDLAKLGLDGAKLIVLDDPSVAGAVSGAPFVLDALEFDTRMLAARAVITGGAALRPRDLRGTLISEAATRARQSGVPCAAIVGRNDVDAFGARILDLELVAQAGSAKAIERAAQALAPHLPSS